MTFALARTVTAISHRPHVAQDARIYAMGDIHGRYDLMIGLLRAIAADGKARADHRRCHIVFLGDYIDRGARSRQVIDALKRLAHGALPGVTVLRGNHEQAMLDFIDDPWTGRAWLGYGAAPTIADYGLPPPPAHPDRTTLLALRDALVAAMGEDVDFLRSLPSQVASGDVLFTHAALVPDETAGTNDLRPALWGDRSATTDWPVEGKLMVHGHYDGPEPINRPGRICVDTGAYYSGRLTAVRLDDGYAFLTVRG